MIDKMYVGLDEITKLYIGNELMWSSVFSPLDLFKGGQQGIWLDPSDLTSLFQDVAGTIPVTKNGDPVGLVRDKSGNGNHVTQAISASRPTYKTDGILHWLAFDGVDDWMKAEGFSWLTSDNLDTKAIISVGYKSDPNLGYLMHASGTVGAGTQRFGMLLNEGQLDKLRLGVDTSYRSSPVNTKVVSAYYSIPNKIGQCLLDSESTKEIIVADGTGSSNMLSIGCRTPSSPAIFYKGDLYSMAIAQENNNQGTLSELHKHTTKKSKGLL